MVSKALLREYCEYRGIRLEELPEGLVDSLLKSIKASIESYTGRTIEETIFTDMHPAGQMRYVLLKYPVLAVNSVMVDDTPVTDYILNSRYGVIRLPEPAEGEVAIEYVAGDPENQALYDELILETFYTRIYEYTHGMYKGLKSLREGDLQMTFLSSQPWLPVHVAERLEGLRRPMVGVMIG